MSPAPGCRGAAAPPDERPSFPAQPTANATRQLLEQRDRQPPAQSGLPVASMETRYIRPARYDELLTVRTALRQFPTGKHMTFYVEVYNEAKKLVNGGKVRLVFVDMDTNHSIVAPAFFTKLLLPFFPEQSSQNPTQQPHP